MPNDFFQFKQFIINQDKCAMKVCTDACLFGALLPVPINLQGSVLDIGTGTGLLSLMYTQRFEGVRADAVEIDADAFSQAKENFELSKWGDRLRVFHQDIVSFAQTHPIRYDLIFCNPPFFENDLKSQDSQRNVALHSMHLTLAQLLESINILLAPEGEFCVLLPFTRRNYFVDLAIENGFIQKNEISIRQTPKHPFFRTVLHFGRIPRILVVDQITIKEEENIYSLKFTELLKDYYLYL